MNNMKTTTSLILVTCATITSYVCCQDIPLMKKLNALGKHSTITALLRTEQTRITALMRDLTLEARELRDGSLDATDKLIENGLKMRRASEALGKIESVLLHADSVITYPSVLSARP